MSANPDSLVNQPGQVGSHIAPSKPLTTKGHAPGVKASPADHAPEFHAQTLPAGTAPPERTFAPNPTEEVPAQTANPDVDPEGVTSAADTLGGASSKDVARTEGFSVGGGRHEKKAKEGQGLSARGARMEKDPEREVERERRTKGGMYEAEGGVSGFK
ncbi:MAG: hypothetical protein M1824_003577 [Vezdaea acicularis]|nr:MAG: hypothetical protein M1824_003577 [Vezdaea acicularis]